MNRQNFRIGLLDEGATRMSCLEARCEQYERGWVTVVDESSDLGQKQAHYIRKESGRGFTECRSEEADEHLGGEGISIPPGMTVFIFAPGQPCFQEHRDREVVFVHEKRGATRVHANPLDFNEHFNEEAYKVGREIEKG